MSPKILHLEPNTLPVMGSTVITDKAETGGMVVTDDLAVSSSGEKSSSIIVRLITQALMTWDATGIAR